MLPSTEQLTDPDYRPSPLSIDLDWETYFDGFKSIHGEPVVYKDKLLFADGWGYSQQSKEGPEYPPPSNLAELHKLQLSYWLIRLRVVQNEYHALRDLLQNLRDLQRRHSLPLQCSSMVYDEEQKQHRPRKQVLDLEEIENGRLAWLREDVEVCRYNLKMLNEARNGR